jgi:hypothetical protein
MRATVCSLLCFVLVYHVLPVDLPSLVYASCVVLIRQQTSESSSSSSSASLPMPWALFVAKYNGFAVNLAITYSLLCVLKNLKRLLRQNFGCLRFIKTWEYNLGWPTYSLNKSHAHYAYRGFISGVLHTVTHAAFSHRFRVMYDPRYSLPVKVDDLLFNTRPAFGDIGLWNQTVVVVRSLFADSYTWTGYLLLLLLLVPVGVSGLRLARYARHHFQVLTAHRILATLIIPLMAYHHPFYGWPALWLILYLVDYAVGVFLYTEQCVVVRVRRYPNYQLENPGQENDVVDLTFCYPYKKMIDFQPGDYVRIKIPAISRYEWHDFTLMKSSDSFTVLDCTAHVTIRSVGKWTRLAYLLAEDNGTTIMVKGPYSLNLYDPLMNRILQCGQLRFMRSSEFIRGSSDRSSSGSCRGERSSGRRHRPISTSTCCGCYKLVSRVEMPRVLILACTGSAITHVISILDALIPMYYSGFNEYELPRKIVVCWTVRTIFNLNFGLLPLSRYQRQLSVIQLDELLHYEFFVTEQPSNSDALSAQMFRRMLISCEDNQPITTLYDDYRTASFRSQLIPMKIFRQEGDTSAHASSALALSPPSLFVRNSRLSMMDIVSGGDGRRNINTSMGSRPNYDTLAKRHVFGEPPDQVLIIVNSSVREIQREFERMARKYKCRLSCDNIY